MKKNCPYCGKNYTFKKYNSNNMDMLAGIKICEDDKHRFGYHDFEYINFFVGYKKYFCSFYDAVRDDKFDKITMLDNKWKIIVYEGGIDNSLLEKVSFLKSKDHFKTKEDFNRFLEMASLLG
jgi:hypothetical protein